MQGKFITIEGSEGSGKSSVINELEKALIQKNINHLITKEPGSFHDSVCIELREFILNPNRKINSNAELYLYMADRCQHVSNVISPAIKSGKLVVSDRYIDSSYAYQGWGRRYGLESELTFIDFLNKKSTFGVIPDLTIILQVSPEIGLSRSTIKEFGKRDRIEQEDIEFFNRVKNGFDYLLKNNIDRNLIGINTDNKSISEVSKLAWDEINKILC